MSYIPFVPPHGENNVLSKRTGIQGEFTVDSSTKEFVYYDGTTLGGIRMARKDLVEDLADSVKDLTTAINSILEYMETNNVLTKTSSSS